MTEFGNVPGPVLAMPMVWAGRASPIIFRSMQANGLTAGPGVDCRGDRPTLTERASLMVCRRGTPAHGDRGEAPTAGSHPPDHRIAR